MNGSFLVRSVYWESINLEASSRPPPVFGRIWKSKILETLKMMLGRVALDILPTKEKLSRYATEPDLSSLCGHSPESSLHIFVESHISRALWFGSPWGFRIDRNQVNSTMQFVEIFLDPPKEWVSDDQERVRFLLYGALVVDFVWRCRNKSLREDRVLDYYNLCTGLKKIYLEHWHGR